MHSVLSLPIDEEVLKVFSRKFSIIMITKGALERTSGASSFTGRSARDTFEDRVARSRDIETFSE